jgi:hypothetical protein
MSEFVDGRRWPERAITPDSSVAPDAPAAPDPDQQAQPGAFPEFTVHAGYVMRPDSIALHFHPDTAPVLAELFPAQADNLHAAALDVEMEAERQQHEAADRAVLRGVGL